MYRSEIFLTLYIAVSFFNFYSVLKAVTGSLFAAFLEGINPPIRVRTTLSRIRISAGAG